MDRNSTIGLVLIGLIITVFSVMNQPSEAEIKAANQNHFQNWCIGDRVLRTETAPVVALSVLNYHFSIK